MPNSNSDPAISLEEDEVAGLDDAEGADDVCIVMDEGTADGRLAESPTRIVSPAIGPATPIVCSN